MFDELSNVGISSTHSNGRNHFICQQTEESVTPWLKSRESPNTLARLSSTDISMRHKPCPLRSGMQSTAQ